MDRVGDTTYDKPGGLPVPVAIERVEGGNNNTRNPEEDFRDMDMGKDMTDYAPDALTEDKPDLDADTNNRNAKNSGFGGPDDGNDATRSDVEGVLLNIIAADITENAGIKKHDDNSDDSAITGVDERYT